MENPILGLMNEHRSIRKFKDKQLTQKQVDQLISAAQHAATSTFSQQYSIISVTDPDILHEIGGLTTRHWMEDSGHYFVIIADQYRNLQLAKEAGVNPKMLSSTDKFLASVYDASIATQNMVIAAEGMGLGTTIMGSVLNNSRHLIELLHLPELTFPLLGLAVGYPAEIPDLKPRLPKELMYFQNGYKVPFNFHAKMADYNKVVANYYNSRDTNNKKMTFSEHIVDELTNRMERPDVFESIQSQGLMLN
ncbi:NADPH-dependent oxidoreductase [Lentilactobacillus laojiaonis]|uniref:NADPH-dependent oxidoreductase n=1 Tax=Lentilactobacillus laojiaonis TaxID=2883998 RepID=UPI001D0A91F3|nr:NADPH-dependent oxidoreductase [Lentilactobacillus laojiaonis]UDM32125.1 NADPH-dependent oxidoreductase [Lentilactobacillus laojiaonis]